MSGQRRVKQVAVIGGGVCGATAALTIAAQGGDAVEVTIFDQGRRGTGGRASHRRVPPPARAATTVSPSKRRSPLSVPSPIPDDGMPPAGKAACLEFDHGCQFFRCETPRFAEVLASWIEQGWAMEWKGDFRGDGDFFGFPASPPFYVGVGGNHLLIRSMLGAAPSNLTIRGQTRVSGIEYKAPPRSSAVADGPDAWVLSGTSGSAAFHDTPEMAAARALPDGLGAFDAVLVTDASASFGGWHRASAGLPESFGARVRARVRVPLFVCMVAFDSRLPDGVPDAASFDDGDVWFAARTRSKPGYAAATGMDCWTLVSSPGFAVREISITTMQDPETGVFKPQDECYLQNGPCQHLLRSFYAKLQNYGATKASGFEPKIVYLQGQRWGSAFPAPANCGGRDEDGASKATTQTVVGVRYEKGRPKLRLPTDPAELAAQARHNFVKDQRRLYYAGDYCSVHTPGIEASVLSALDAAAEIAKGLQLR